jgi:hypothetical protein
MIRREFKTMSVFNPFKDENEDLYAEFECHFDSHGKLDHVDTASIVTEAGVELFNYMDQKYLDSVAADFRDEWGDMV